MTQEELKYLVIVVGTAIAVFLMLREFFLWYTGVNRIVDTQKKTNFLLLKILENSGGRLTEEEKNLLNKD
jgi:hypothetical protein